MQGSEFIQAQIARLAYYDGFSEGLNGMIAVCHAIKNRQTAGWWGGDWIQLLSNHRNYSSRLEPYPDTLPDPRVYSFQSLLQEIPRIFSGQSPDDVTIPRESVLARPAPKVLYYAKLNEITNDWFLEEISRKPEIHPRIAQVGALTFFA